MNNMLGEYGILIDNNKCHPVTDCWEGKPQRAMRCLECNQRDWRHNIKYCPSCGTDDIWLITKGWWTYLLWLYPVTWLAYLVVRFTSAKK